MQRKKKRPTLTKSQNYILKESLKQFLGPSLIDNHVETKIEPVRLQLLREALTLRILK